MPSNFSASHTNNNDKQNNNNNNNENSKNANNSSNNNLQDQLVRPFTITFLFCLDFYQIVDMLVKLLSPRQEDDEKQEIAADLRETIERHDEQ